MRILICGSRTWADWATIYAMMMRIPKPWAYHTIIQGDATGADRIAKRLAESHGFGLESYPAKWKQYGNAAGPIRNSEMLTRNPDEVWAFRMPGKSTGTDDMCKKARTARVPVVLFTT